jgi:hypothetical protein
LLEFTAVLRADAETPDGSKLLRGKAPMHFLADDFESFACIVLLGYHDLCAQSLLISFLKWADAFSPERIES